MISTKNLNKGDLVEIALSDNAGIFSGNAHIYSRDNSVNIPGRHHLGYVARVNDDAIFLVECWDKMKNEPQSQTGVVQIYFDAIKYYRRKTKSDWTETIRSY